MPSGVDFELFQPIERAAARDRLGWDRDEPIVFFNSGKSVLANKRSDLAQAAVEVASQMLGRQVKLHMVRGDTAPAMIPIMMSAADSLIMTSEFEGSPNVVKEAIACNLPVVSVDVGDVVERLDGVEQSFVCARSPQALGAALAEVIRSHRRSNGRLKAPEISREALAAKIISVYRQCLNRPVGDASGAVGSPVRE